jgi:hypothetical protein
VPAFWRDRLIAISYSPLTRVDVQRMRQLGVLTYEEVIEAFLDRGYAEANARRLAGFTERRRADFLRKAPVARLYVQGGAGREEVERQLSEFKATKAEVDAILAALDVEVKAKARKACVAAIRKRFLAGEYSGDEVRQELQGRGIPTHMLLALSEQWACERSSKERSVPAATLCQWFARSLITEQDFRLRLVRLGYSGVDAARVVAQCKEGVVHPLRAKTARDAAKLAADEKKAAEKAAREKESAQAQAEKEHRNRDREDAAEARRKQKLRKFAEKLASEAAVDAEVAAGWVEDWTVLLIDQYDRSQVEAETFLVGLTKTISGAEFEGLDAFVKAALAVELSFDQISRPGPAPG